jgi:hypothetical protein
MGKKQQVVPNERLTLIDEAGQLESEITQATTELEARLAAKQARLDFLRASIIEWYNNEPAEKAIALAGTQYIAKISARGNKSRIKDLEALFHAMGVSKFFEFASIPLGVLRKLLSKSEYAEHVLTERTGDRSLELVQIAGDSAGKAA